jgi:ectoine hydroxylase-related dioxygenase (phytanoyl-CoA dioxygenase family)
MISRTTSQYSSRLSGNVRLLTAEEISETSHHAQELHARGYTLFPNAFTQEEILTLKNDIDHVYENVPRDYTIMEGSEFRHRMLCHSRICQDAVSHPSIIATIAPLLGEDCHVIANTAWRQKPQCQNYNVWHTDAGPHIPLPEGVKWPSNIPHPVFAIAVHIFLEDCPLEAGPTAVIPTSHLSGQSPPASVSDDLSFDGHTLVPIIAKAGDVAFFVSDVWHRRLSSTGEIGRYFLQVHYGRRDIAQRMYPTEVVNHLSPDAKAHAERTRRETIVGLHNVYFYDG